MEDLWLGDDLRSQLRVAEDPWQFVTSKLTEQTKMKGERLNNLDISRSPTETKLKEKNWVQEDNKYESLNFRMMNFDMKMNETAGKASLRNGLYNMNVVYPKNNLNGMNSYNMSIGKGKVINSNVNKEANNNGTGNNGNNNNNNVAVDKRFKTLPSTEMLPRNEVLGGYIFVCNNDTMQEDLKRQLFGLPPRYRDSVRAITPGLPLFLYNYTTHQLHGIFEATSFGGSNIDPTAWEDKKCKGESRFPAQVRIRVRKLCKALEEDAFRPVLHHYDGPKFRLELSVPETMALLDLCEQEGL